MEPTSTITAALAFAANKAYYGIAALFTSMVVLFLSKNQRFRDNGRLATAALVSGVSVGFSIIFGGFVAVWFGMSPWDANVALLIGGLFGLFTWTVLRAWVAYLDKMEGKDIVEVIEKVQEDIPKVKRTKKPEQGTKE